MTAIRKLDVLKARHAKLDRSIEKEEARLSADINMIYKWKKEKLKIKDMIAEISLRRRMA